MLRLCLFVYHIIISAQIIGAPLFNLVLILGAPLGSYFEALI